MKTFLFTCPVLKVSGRQYYRVEAETLTDARWKWERGDVEFLSEEIEVTQIGSPQLKQVKVEPCKKN